MTKDYPILVKSGQLEGKKKLAVNDFLKGYDIKLGTVLGR